MAIDDALLASVAEGAPPVVRVYRWRPACLSFGRNQQARGEYDANRIRGFGWDVVRRPTGGLAVLHDAELTYAVIAPAGLLGGPRAAYKAIHAAIARGLASLGVRTSLAGPGPVRSPQTGAPACFAAPAGGEIVAAGGKLVGSAQRCVKRTVLQHGSLLLRGRQQRVDQARISVGRAADGSTSLAAVLGDAPPVAELAAALCAGFRAGLGIDLEPADLSDRERGLALHLEDRYRDDGWTWRR